MSRPLLPKSPPKCLEYTSKNCKEAHLGDGVDDAYFDSIILKIVHDPIDTYEKANDLCHTIFGFRNGNTFDNLLNPNIHITNATKVKFVIDVSHWLI